MRLIEAIKRFLTPSEDFEDDDVSPSTVGDKPEFDDMDDDEWYINPAYHSPDYGGRVIK